MARAKWCGDEVYAAADSFKEQCLRLDGSLFEPGVEIWSAEPLGEVEARVGIEDLGGGSFIEKLEGQLAGLGDAEIRLGAELLYVLLLLPGLDTHGPTKREHLTTILGMLSTSVEIPADLDRALDSGGVANFAAAKAHRDAYMRFLARVSGRIKDMAAADRERVLDDPWAFRAVVADTRTTTDGMAANALLHLFYPEKFEYMISDGHRAKLTSAFGAAPGVADESDVDRKIGLIRELAGSGGELDFDLYEDPFQRIWKEPASAGWQEAIKWSRLLYERKEFDKTERNHKLEIAARLAAARDALLSGDGGWPALLRKAFSYHRNNLTFWGANNSFLGWCDEGADDAGKALRLLWEPADGGPALRAFLDALPAEAVSGRGNRLSIASFLLLGLDATRWPYFMSTVQGRLLAQLGEEGVPPDDLDPETLVRPEELSKRLGLNGERVRGFLRDRYPRPPGEQYSAWYLTADQVQSVVDRFSDEIDRESGEATYAEWMATLEELRLRMLAAGAPIRDLLDAQGIAWWLTKRGAPEDWSPEQRAAFEAFRRGETPPSDGIGPIVLDGLLPPVTSELAAGLHLPDVWLRELFGLLEEKRQVVLYGPPGTGKTYIAQRVGEHIARAGGSVRLVQFHPSYTYEDFFEGYRPSTSEGDGTLRFDLVHGALRLISEAAAREPDKPHLLIIDEINRGNIAKVFGELYFLLEYRDQSIGLQYSPREQFKLPPNLYVIGTMNTADRSIALVDSALRRRFYFEALMPTRAPVKYVLRRWLESHGHGPEPADLLDALNREIGAEEFSIGPSYLMTGDGSPPDLERSWKHQIMPLLEEHFYGSGRDVEHEFGLAAIRRRIAAEADSPADGSLDDPA